MSLMPPYARERDRKREFDSPSNQDDQNGVAREDRAEN